MNTVFARHACGVDGHGGGATSFGTAASDWLSFAATPSLAFMALLAACTGGPPDILCSAAAGPSLLRGMVPMYVIMSALHCGPWVRLIARRR